MKLNNEDLVCCFKERGYTKKDSREFLATFVDIIGDILSRGDKVHIHKLGTLGVREAGNRNFVSVDTGELTYLGSVKTPTFFASPMLKQIINTQRVVE